MYTRSAVWRVAHPLATALTCPSVAFALAVACPTLGAQQYHLGSPAPKALIEAWDIDVRPDGAGLPAGQGSVAQGRELYAQRCAACHGVRGEGGPQDRLAGGQRSLTSAAPVKTVGSFWPYATTLFDYVRRAMPFDAPQSLDDDAVYAVVAFLLHLNGIVPETAVMTRITLPSVEMPNRQGFIAQPIDHEGARVAPR